MDYLTEAGAHHLAETIVKVWAERGCDPDVEVIFDGQVYVVRSDIRNGFAPNPRLEAAALLRQSFRIDGDPLARGGPAFSDPDALTAYLASLSADSSGTTRAISDYS